MTDLPDARLRLDVWLWRARFFRTRGLATAHVTGRGVRITRLGQTRRVDKAGTGVCVGDVLTFAAGPHIHTIRIVGLGTRRGPASEAQGLYEPAGEE